MTAARLATVVVLPAPGRALVTITTMEPRVAAPVVAARLRLGLSSSTELRRPRNASATVLAGRSALATPSRCRLGMSGISASTGSPMASSACSRVRIRESSRSTTSARAPPSSSPSRAARPIRK